MKFHERVKYEREKKKLSQAELADKLHVTRQSVSKWETGGNYPSIEVLISISDLFGITLDELLRTDEELKEKVIRDSKQLAYPRLKEFFDVVFIVGLLIIVMKFGILFCNKVIGMDITILQDNKIFMFLPLALIIIGGVGTEILKTKYKDD